MRTLFSVHSLISVPARSSNNNSVQFLYDLFHSRDVWFIDRYTITELEILIVIETLYKFMDTFWGQCVKVSLYDLSSILLLDNTKSLVFVFKAKSRIKVTK